MAEKIFIKAMQNDYTGDYYVGAFDIEGNRITQHISSDLDWARHDIMRPSHIKKIEEWCPDGYELVWRF